MSDQQSLTIADIANSTRSDIRVLFISDDESLLQPNKQTLDGYLQLGSVFDEVHILVMRVGASSPFPVLRVGHNTWLYTVSTDTWWWAPVPAMILIKEQLIFNGEFRPDLIVAREPFVSGVLAHWLGKKYNRPVQAHVTIDYTSEKFTATVIQPKWHQRMARYVLKRTKSVRTASAQMQSFVHEHFPDIQDLSVLPRFNNYSLLKDLPIVVNIREKYPQYHFTYLFVGDLSHDSTLPVVINAMRGILQNQTVGLFVLGSGKAKKDYQALCQKLGLERQVVFCSDSIDLVSCLKTTDVVVVTDETAEADEVLLQAAAVGTPAVALETQLRSNHFVDQQSILFVSAIPAPSLQFQLSAILNNLSLRSEIKDGVKNLLTDTLHEDIEVYRLAYKQSIESALLTVNAVDAKL